MCGRSDRGKSTEPTGKFSPAARAAICATSSMSRHSPSRSATDRRPDVVCLNHRECGQGAPHPPERRPVADPAEPANLQPGEREPPVASIEHTGGAVVVALAGELDLYNAGDVRA